MRISTCGPEIRMNVMDTFLKSLKLNIIWYGCDLLFVHTRRWGEKKQSDFVKARELTDRTLRQKSKTQVEYTRDSKNALQIRSRDAAHSWF